MIYKNSGIIIYNLTISITSCMCFESAILLETPSSRNRQTQMLFLLLDTNYSNYKSHSWNTKYGYINIIWSSSPACSIYNDVLYGKLLNLIYLLAFFISESDMMATYILFHYHYTHTNVFQRLSFPNSLYLLKSLLFNIYYFCLIKTFGVTQFIYHALISFLSLTVQVSYWLHSYLLHR